MEDLEPVIISSQTDKKKLYYMVQWKDKSLTKESRTELNKWFPTLIENYENKFSNFYLATR